MQTDPRVIRADPPLYQLFFSLTLTLPDKNCDKLTLCRRQCAVRSTGVGKMVA